MHWVGVGFRANSALNRMSPAERLRATRIDAAAGKTCLRCALRDGPQLKVNESGLKMSQPL